MTFAKIRRLSCAVGAGLALAAPAAHAAADLSGVYYDPHPGRLRTTDGRAPPLTAAGRKAMTDGAAKLAATKAAPKGEAMEACLPLGPVRILQQPYPMEVVQKGDQVVLIWEHNHAYERIYMNEKPLPDRDPGYMGYSVGRWDGPTLVIDTANFNSRTFLDDAGLPHGAALKVERRIRRAPGGKGLEIVAKVDDPEMYSRPWRVRTVIPSRPDVHIEEFVCGQNTLETRHVGGSEAPS